MDVKLVEQYIAEVLTEKFECEFEICKALRDFNFRSNDYYFTFPLGLKNESAKESLQRKVRNWLEQDIDNICPDCHIIYNSNGTISSDSILRK
ncbi:hypothetical protein [Vibrio anguillarum]|uniref:hypothetical protein n=1 Tax=Vibrio anguillarum TaxID=55601 RepID=UPI0030ED7C74